MTQRARNSPRTAWYRFPLQDNVMRGWQRRSKTHELPNTAHSLSEYQRNKHGGSQGMVVEQQKLKWLESQYKSNTKKKLEKNCDEKLESRHFVWHPQNWLRTLRFAATAKKYIVSWRKLNDACIVIHKLSANVIVSDYRHPHSRS